MLSPIVGLLALLAGCDLAPPGDPFPVQARIDPSRVVIPVSRVGAPPQFSAFTVENVGASMLYITPAPSLARTTKNDPVEDGEVEGLSNADVATLLSVQVPAYTRLSPGRKLPLEVSLDPRSWRWRSGSYEVTFPFEIRYFFSGQALDEPEEPSASEAPTPIAEVFELTVAFEIDCDRDADGYDAVECGGRDCDDTDDTVYPGAPETCDGSDEDCDGAVDEYAEDREPWYLDADNDRYGGDVVQLACDRPGTTWTRTTGDCNDDNGVVNPGASEVANCSDGVDNDCDGLTDREDLACR